ncbi:arginase [soil metagenome]
MKPPGYTLFVIDIIGAAFDLCGPWPGSRLGPEAIRLANLKTTLIDLGLQAADQGDILGTEPATNPGGLRNFPPLLEILNKLRSAVATSLANDHLPIVLGGEHTLAMGSVCAALEKFGDNLTVIWIDAHGDINTPGSSSSGNIHGMPLAALAGMDSETDGQVDSDWKKLQASFAPAPWLKPERVAWYGLRDVDGPESPRLTGLPITMHDIDRRGIESTVKEIDHWLRKIDAGPVWISFDVDSLDPILAPGTGTAVRGGLSYREGHLFAELLHTHLSAPDCPYRLVGLDVVEVNPLRDTNNTTALMAVEWIGSLFGKTILGKR